MKQGEAQPQPLRIVPLTPARFDGLATLFGQGGDPKWCWCAYYRRPGRYWANSTPAKNRAELAQETKQLQRDRRAPGLLAYRGSEVVGWVSVGPRSDYERIERSKVLAAVDDKPVWSIVCFVVARTSRRQGVAAALLEAAVAYAREHGATLLEAYPVDTGGRKVASASAFKGTLSMFERAGFEVVARRQANRASAVRPIVRRRVRGRRKA